MRPTSSCISNNVDKYRLVCNQLDKLGYQYPVLPDSLPLTEELVKDLINYKEELIHCKHVIKELEKEKSVFEAGVEPYARDNARLLKENNELHDQLTKLQEKYESELKELKQTNRHLKNELADLEFINNHTLKKIKEAEKESLEKNKKILQLTVNKTVVLSADGKKKTVSVSNPVLEITEPLKVNNIKLKDKLWASKAQAGDIKVVNMVEIMERRTAHLIQQLDDLRLENQRQGDVIATLKCQMGQRDREIDRLRHALEGGRPLTALSRDSCSQCHQKECKIKSLETQLEESVEKQHEAMTRAVQLAERNQHLERELKDIDNMAMAVEEECQSKVKQNIRNIDILQDKLRQKVEEIKSLERKVSDMKIRIEQESQKAEVLNREKKSLEKCLDISNSEKKALNDKINHYIIVEKNLNMEVAKLQEINKSLQRHVAELEARVNLTMSTDKSFRCSRENEKVERGRQKKKNHVHGISSPRETSNYRYSSSPSPTRKSAGDKITKKPSQLGDCLYSSPSIVLMDKLQQERDFYHKECHRLKEQICNYSKMPENDMDLIRKLNEKEREIEALKQENCSLRQEQRLKYSDHINCPSGDSIKIVLDRLERERDAAVSDVTRLQEERDALRERIKIASETQATEHSRMERIIIENEERIRRLEAERRELITNHSASRASLSNLEEKCDEYKQQLRNVQDQLSQMTTHYSQLKALQEETDRSLSDAQGRLTQCEVELTSALSKVKDLEKEKQQLEEEISNLKKEKTTLKSNLTCLEKEKDGLLITLDEKTEKTAKLESELKKYETRVEELNEKISHLQKKFEVAINEKTNQDHAYRSLEHGIEHLKEELEQCERQKEAAVRENRRLQDDLTSAIKDCHTARRDLENERQEVENLKRQLQQYVNEVKRAEELLSKKESERNEMLDHFRSLSLEATALETNNHTLESEMESTKTQLMNANHKLMDLESQVCAKDSLVTSYEKQIAELTTQIAELEGKLQLTSEQKTRAEEDLAALRELCSTIDGQKEVLRRQANNYDSEKVHLMNEVRRLSEEYEGLSQKLSHERALSQSLENSLSNSRQETLEHKITNKDLQSHIQHLRQKVDELTQKLDRESTDVRRYQNQCAELSQQVSELRREVTNARFDQARSVEDSRRDQNNQSCSVCNYDIKEDPMLMPVRKFPYDQDFSIENPISPPNFSSRTYTWSPCGNQNLPVNQNLPINQNLSMNHSPITEMKMTSLEDCGNDPDKPCPCCSKLCDNPQPPVYNSQSFSSYPKELLSGNFENISNYVSTAQGKPTGVEVSDQVRASSAGANLQSPRRDTFKRDEEPDDEVEEESNEIHFEAKPPEEKSSRNIPPLVIEDSDRTVSTPNSEEYNALCQIDSTFRKTFILSPVPEKAENRTGSDKTIHADTSSELSSLPDDNEQSTKKNIQESVQDSACCPTFSIRQPKITFASTYDARDWKSPDDSINPEEKDSGNASNIEPNVFLSPRVQNQDFHYHTPRRIIADCKFKYKDDYSDYSRSSEADDVTFFHSKDKDENFCPYGKGQGFKILCESVAKMNSHTFSTTTEIISNLSTPNGNREFFYDKRSNDDFLGTTDSDEYRFSDSCDQDIDETTFSIDERGKLRANVQFHSCKH